MRFVSSVPAQQLQSVAQRYRRVAQRRGRTERGHSWWDMQLAHQHGAALHEEDAIARRQRVEAVLLLSREPLNSRKLAQYARLADGTEARTMVRVLNQLYDETGRAFRVEEVAGGYQLLTRSRFAPWLRRLEHVPRQVRLSAPAMETLAVVAYRQPVLRAEIEAIRGVNCGEILRQLMERDLVRIGGRSDELGRPYLYTTTKRFLQLFGLQSLDSLPRATVLRDGAELAVPIQPGITRVATDEAQQEQEKSEVTVTSPTQLPVNRVLEETQLGEGMSAQPPLAPQGIVYDSDDADYDADDEDYDDEDEADDDFEEVDDEEADDEDVEEEEFEDEEFEEEDEEEEDEDFEEGFEEDEWEEVEDDEEEGDWEEDEEEWDDDEFDEEDDDEEDDEDDDYEYEEEEEEDWE